MKANWLVCVILLLLLDNACDQKPSPTTAATNSASSTNPTFDPKKPYTIVSTAKKGFDLATAKPVTEETRAKAEKGDAAAQVMVGYWYYSGQDGTKDLGEAVKWFRKAAEQGNGMAQALLGMCYGRGDGVAKDSSEATKWFRKAAEQGDANAQFVLGACYGAGEGVNKDSTEAVKWYRKAAEQNLADAQFSLGTCYVKGEGVTKDVTGGVMWYHRAAEQNYARAQFYLGVCYNSGEGIATNHAEAVKWYRRAAEQNEIRAQFNLGTCYEKGEGVTKNYVEAAKWYRKAAEQNLADAQFNLGALYAKGEGAAKDYLEAYKWCLLAAAQGHEFAKTAVPELEHVMTREQIAEGQKMARNFKPRESPADMGDSSAIGIAQTRPESSGTGFFITEDGYLVTNEHVAGNGAQVRLVTSAGLISAKVVKVDAANDLALLKAEGRFAPLPIAASRGVKLGGTVATVGFPNIGLQGFAPKLAKGEIASLSGAGDDARYLQISVPVQPGNSGGALVDERGNVVGVVSAKLKEPNTKERKFEDVVKDAEQAAVLVLVY